MPRLHHLFRHKHEIVETTFPYLNTKIDLNELHENGKLLTEEEIDKHVEVFSQNTSYNRLKYSPKNRKSRHLFKFNLDQGLNPPAHKEKKHQTNQEKCAEIKKQTFISYAGKKSNKHLGEGTFGKVKLVENAQSGDFYVVKILKKSVEKLLAQEIIMLRKFDQLVGEMTRYDEDKNKNNHKLLLIKEIPGINLQEFILNKPNLPYSHWLIICRNICAAVYDFYDKGALHCDLKPANIMIDPVSYKITLTDYGNIIRVPGGYTEVVIGSRGYMASELLCNQTKIHNQTTVANSLGITLSDVLNTTYEDYRLHKDLPPSAFTQRYRVRELTDLAPHNQAIPLELLTKIVSLLHELTSDDPKERPSFKEATDFFDYLLKGLINDAACARKIGVINLDEYNEATPAQKDQLISAMKTMDEVWFIENQPKNKLDYYKLRRELESKQIKIGDKLFHVNPRTASMKKILNLLSEHLDSQAHPYADLQHYFYLSSANQAAHKLDKNQEKQCIQPIFTQDNASVSDYQKIVDDYLKTAINTRTSIKFPAKR